MKLYSKLLLFTFAVLLFSGFGFANNFAFAASSGPRSPGTEANVVIPGQTGDNWWDHLYTNSPTDAKTENGVGDGTAGGNEETSFSAYLKVTNFGFSIPSGATIDGIVVEVKKVNGYPGDSFYDYRARIVKGGVIGNTDRSSLDIWPDSYTYVSYGSSVDKWGEEWTVDDINVSTFGFAISVACTSELGCNSDVAEIDHIRITVYYTAGGNIAPTIGTGPSDGGSSTATPTTAGNNVTFTATATDSESDNYYLAICKTNAITANNEAVPTCTGGNWCISSSTASASQATCNYTTLKTSPGSKDWYAFVCDHDAASACSSMSQGSGNNGSPFVVSGGIARIKNTATYSAGSWLSGWLYRKKIVISKSKVDSDLTDFPLLVKLNSDTAVGTKGLSTGYDLRFTSSDGTTLLAYERESFAVASSKATANIWVKVPTITTATDTVIYMYYGKADATDDWTDDSSSLTNCSGITNAQCTWKEGASQNFAGVWHLKDNAANTNVSESTSVSNTGTAQQNTSAITTTGKISNAMTFNGSSDYISTSTTNGVKTISFWVYSTSTNASMINLTATQYIDSTTGTIAANNFTSPTIYVNGSASSTLTANAWKYISVTTGTGIDSNAITFGKANSAYTTGNMDEVRLSSTARSAAWVKFEYFNQASATNQLSIYPQEQTTYAKMKSVNTKTSASWLTGWSYRKKITIAKTKVDADLSNFPLLVKLNSDTLIGAKARSDGYDIRFTSSDGTTLLAYERESFAVASSKATAVMWVKVPTITTASDTVIYMYYTNASATTDWTVATSELTNCTSITNAQCVWKEGASQNFAGVWHSQNASTTTIADSTSGANTGTKKGVGEPVEATGKVGQAQTYDGTDDKTQMSVPILSGTQDFTISAFINRSTFNSFDYIAGNYGTGNTSGVEFYLFNTANGNFLTLYISASLNGTTPIAANRWYYVTATRLSGVAKLYVNGVEENSASFNGSIATTNNFTIGNGQDYNTEAFGGLIDEVRVSSSTRSASWTKFEYFNMASTNNQLTISAQEQNTSASLKKR